MRSRRSLACDTVGRAIRPSPRRRARCRTRWSVRLSSDRRRCWPGSAVLPPRRLGAGHELRTSIRCTATTRDMRRTHAEGVADRARPTPPGHRGGGIERQERPHHLRGTRARPAADAHRAASRSQPGRAREPGRSDAAGAPRSNHVACRGRRMERVARGPTHHPRLAPCSRGRGGLGGAADRGQAPLALVRFVARATSGQRRALARGLPGTWIRTAGRTAARAGARRPGCRSSLHSRPARCGAAPGRTARRRTRGRRSG